MPLGQSHSNSNANGIWGILNSLNTLYYLAPIISRTTRRSSFILLIFIFFPINTTDQEKLIPEFYCLRFTSNGKISWFEMHFWANNFFWTNMALHQPISFNHSNISKYAISPLAHHLTYFVFFLWTLLYLYVIHTSVNILLNAFLNSILKMV